MKIRPYILTLVIIGLMAAPQSVWAYIGPGAGISAIGTVVAFIGAILLAIVGFVWYPMKRLLVKIRKKKGDAESVTATVKSDEESSAQETKAS